MERQLRIRLVFVVFGASIALLSGIVILLGDGDARWCALPLALGAGFVAIGVSPWRAPPTRMSELALLVVLATAYSGARATPLALVDRIHASDVLLIVIETVIIAGTLHLALLQVFGVSRLALLLAKLDTNGYAPVLDETQAEGVIAAELARSRRRGEPLIFVVIAHERFEKSTLIASQFDARSIRYLEDVYLRARICRLLSDHARRSDVIVCRSDRRFLIMSPGTDVSGAQILAQRVVAAAALELGASLICDIASLPADAETLRDLRDTAVIRVEAAAATDIVGEVDVPAPQANPLAAGQ